MKPGSSETFSSRMLSILNNSMLSLMLGIGHETGLFDIMSQIPPSTSQQIATAAGLQERYVREWLAAMVSGQIVTHEPEHHLYHLPTEHAAVLTRASGASNMARFSLLVTHLASVQSGVVASFRQGGGVGYPHHAAFMDLWAEVNKERYDARWYEALLALIPDAAERMRSGATVLDLGCGDGHIIALLARDFPASAFLGCDVRPQSIAAGRSRARQLALRNLDFAARDITSHRAPETYHLITAFDTVHDLAHPQDALRAVHDMLVPGGVFLMVDVAASSDLHENLDHPMGAWLYTTSCMHCTTVSLAEDGDGLGTMWGRERALAMLAEAGFHEVAVHRMDEDPFNNYYVAHKPAPRQSHGATAES